MNQIHRIQLKEIVKGNTEDHLRALIPSNGGIISSEQTEVFLEMFSLKLSLIVGLVEAVSQHDPISSYITTMDLFYFGDM